MSTRQRYSAIKTRLRKKKLSKWILVFIVQIYTLYVYIDGRKNFRVNETLGIFNLRKNNY